MLPSVDEALLGSLQKGLADHVSSDAVVFGTPEAGKKSRVYIHNDDFVIEEVAMGSMVETKYKEADETFDGDGKAKEFKLSGSPIDNIRLIEYPKGTVRFPPDDYAVDVSAGIVMFRDAPPKGKGNIRVLYTLPEPMGEISYLRFVLTYGITVVSGDRDERDKITLAAIEAVYRDMAGLSAKGIEDIRLVKGYTLPIGDDGSMKANTLIYSVVASMKIERAIPPMGKVDIQTKAIKK
jgi:hypothetical protein